MMGEWNPDKTREADSMPDANTLPSYRSAGSSWYKSLFHFLHSSYSTLSLLIASGFALIYVADFFGIAGISRQVQGDTIIFSPEPWVVAVTAFLALAVAVIGWLTCRKRKWIGYLLIGGGILVLGTTVPGLAVSKTVIDPDHFEWWRGFHHVSMRFDDVSEIVHSVKRVRAGWTIQDVHYFDFRKKDGQAVHVQVEPPDRFIIDAIPEILGRARSKGVMVTEPPRE